jgi:predicted permease
MNADPGNRIDWTAVVRRHLAHLRLDDSALREMAEHLADRYDDARRSGESHEDAEAYALADMGLARRRWWSGLAGVGSDLRYALRLSRRRPGFTAAAVALIALAVGVATAVFSVVYGLLLRPLPYPHADRLATIFQVQAGGERTQISYADFQDLIASGAFDAAAAMMGGRGTLVVGDAVDRVNVLAIEAPLLAMIGATPALGRLLTPADARQPLVVISHRLWQGPFGGRPDVLSQPLKISGRTYTIVGVLREGVDFELPVSSAIRIEDVDMWSVLDTSEPGPRYRGYFSYEGLVRLRPGVTVEAAQGQLDAIAARLAAQFPATNAERTFALVPLHEQVVARGRRVVLLVFAAGTLLLAVACANLASLFLARRMARLPELAVRAALGATRWRLARQAFVESMVIVTAGGAAALVIAPILLGYIVTSPAADLPRPEAIRLDGAAMAYALGLVVLTAAVLALLPLLGSDRLAMSGSRTTAGRTRLRRGLVAVEVALAFVLAAGAGLVALSLASLVSRERGFETSGVLAMRVSVRGPSYTDRRSTMAAFDRLVQAIRGMPQVASVSAGSGLPLSGQVSGTQVMVDLRPDEPILQPLTQWQFVKPEYFTTLGIPLLRGRDFEPRDVDSESNSTQTDRTTHVTIINETLARVAFGADDPIGRKLDFGGKGDPHVVVGVVKDVLHATLAEPAPPIAYDLVGQHWGETLFLVARARGAAAASLLPEIRRRIRAIDPGLVLFDVNTLDDLVARSVAPRRLIVLLMAGFSASALLLAAIGLYGVLAGLVAERTREIGVRMALGADRSLVMRLILSEGVLIAAIGIAAGFVVTVASGRLLQAHLFGITPLDARALAASGVVLFAASMVASYLPARRATRVDPIVALKAE